MIKGLRPESGFYYFLDITATKWNSEEFSIHLLNNGIVVTPGIAFGIKYNNFIRISLATSKENLSEAFEIIKRLSL